ncbi:MAG TPA: alpha/beta fold hydrolase [Amycolatopsis sp.]|uniref:alpha/beta fold hydrolase n=1 Tax=Amycolatopsis sp. TaxID=37632 RepID=UPI002B4624AB|nr:alpha/beta fold hydrolase [Amycolatopsis sp.]HKS48437.1 alpha/beta fold hydrolase [Amycolatopsis sp.]
MLRTVMGEIVSVVTHVARYPAAVGRRWTIATHRPPSVLTRPLVVLPGLADNMSIFTELKQALPGPIVSFSYSPLIGDVRAAARRLAEQIEELCTVAGVSKVDLVGHSLGGLIARYYVQRLDGDTRVENVVTIATPHRGTMTAWLLSPWPLVRQLRPGSDLLRELAEPAAGCATRFVAFSSTADALVLPARNAQLEHPDLEVRNVVAAGVGHLALAAHRDVLAEIRTLLAPERERAEPAGNDGDSVPRSA